MRLPLLKPSELDEEQKAVYDSIREFTDVAFENFKFMKDDGEVIGPFNAMLHFPGFGAEAWAMNKTMYDHTKLPKSVFQVCVLVTGSHMKARYQVFGHEQLAADAGVPLRKIARPDKPIPFRTTEASSNLLQSVKNLKRVIN